MERNNRPPNIEKTKYQELMAKHLPELRKALGITQSDLAEYIGSTRQSIYSIETQKRPMMWHTFMSLLLLFTSNDATKKKLNEFDINTNEINDYLKVKKSR